MTKILHILSQRPEKTGSGIYLQSLLKISNQKKYKQAVIAGIPAEIKNVDLGNIKKENFYPVKFESENLPFPVVGMSDVMPYKSTCYKDLDQNMLLNYKNEFKKRIKEAVNKFEPDLIITHHLWILTSLVKKLYPDTKVIAISHGTGLRQLQKNQRFSDDVISGCKKLDKVFALTNHQKDEIAKLYGIKKNKIIITGAGYDSEIFYGNKAKTNKEKIKLVYAGKLSASKGVKHLIRACNLLDKDLRDKIEISLYGKGSGKELEKIKETARKANYKIKLPGAVPQEKLAEVFRESDIFCLASFYEGLALVIIEALASGLRVVTTDLAGLKDYLGEKINNSGYVEYVKLPRLKDTDIPCQEDIEKFEKDLSKSIKRQVNNLVNENNIDINELEEDIKNFSWKGIFEKMEKYF